MTMNSTVVKTWTALVHLTNGQTVEQEVRAKTVKGVKEFLKKDAHVRRIVKIHKPKI